MTQIDTAQATTRAEPQDALQNVVGQHLDGVWVLADAAGSRAQASLAATRAIGSFALSVERRRASDSTVQERLRSALEDANATVFEEELRPPASLVFATSIVAAVVSEGRLVLGHAGNARCYRFRAGNRALLTRPHHAVAALELDESTPFAAHRRHLVTRALGIARRADPELSEHVLRSGDLFLLVNDALSWAVEDRHVADLFVYKASAAMVASTIVRLGEQHGTNGAVIAIEVAEVTESRARPVSSDEDAR